MPFIFAAILVALCLLLTPLLPWVTRAAGGGPGASSVATGTPEWIYAGIMALAGAMLWFPVIGLWALLILPLGCMQVKWFGIELGHTRVLSMAGVDRLSTKKPSTIERLGTQWFWERVLNLSIYTPAYSWYIKTIKGTLCALPLGPLAPLHGILWASAYWYGYQVCKRDDGTVEWMAGIASNIVIAAGLLCTIANLLLAERLGA